MLSLDEIPEDELKKEIALRATRRSEGLCDYCARPFTSTPCRFPERHLNLGEEQKRFEAWFLLNVGTPKDGFRTWSSGCYCDSNLQVMWIAWLGCLKSRKG